MTALYDHIDRYQRIEKWARNRYKDSRGWIIACVGNSVAGLPSKDGKAFSVPSVYTVIEQLAAARYLGSTKTPEFSLSEAYRPN